MLCRNVIHGIYRSRFAFLGDACPSSHQRHACTSSPFPALHVMGVGRLSMPWNALLSDPQARTSRAHAQGMNRPRAARSTRVLLTERIVAYCGQLASPPHSRQPLVSDTVPKLFGDSFWGYDKEQVVICLLGGAANRNRRANKEKVSPGFEGVAPAVDPGSGDGAQRGGRGLRGVLAGIFFRRKSGHKAVPVRRRPSVPISNLLRVIEAFGAEICILRHDSRQIRSDLRYTRDIVC